MFPKIKDAQRDLKSIVKRTSFLPRSEIITNGQVNQYFLWLPWMKKFIVLTKAATAVTYFFDPYTNTWSVGPFTYQANSDFNKLLWRVDQKVQILSSQNTNHIYNLDTGEITNFSVPAAISYTYRTVVQLKNGKCLIFGLDNGGSPTTGNYEYDPVANTATAKAVLPVASLALGGCELLDGRVFACGGYNAAASAALATARIYDPLADTWTSVANRPIALANPKCITLPSGDVLVQGGRDTSNVGSNATHVYSLASNTWSGDISLPELPAEPTSFTANSAGYGFCPPDGGVVIFPNGTSETLTFDPASQQMASFWRL